MIQIAVCDDSPHMLELIAKEVESILKFEVQYVCTKTTNPREIIQLIHKTHIHLLLLDIEMPEINGYEIAREAKILHEDTIIIFITNNDIFVYESLKYRPFRFIRKTHIEEMEEALHSAMVLLGSNNQLSSFEISGLAHMNIPLADIIYFESEHNNVKLITEKKEYKFRSTLKIIEKDLELKGFVRIHSGFLVNLKYIYVIRSLDLKVRVGTLFVNLPVSRSRRNEVIQKYKESLRT